MRGMGPVQFVTLTARVRADWMAGDPERSICSCQCTPLAPASVANPEYRYSVFVLEVCWIPIGPVFVSANLIWER
jgi:hypothetical protein